MNVTEEIELDRRLSFIRPMTPNMTQVMCLREIHQGVALGSAIVQLAIAPNHVAKKQVREAPHLPTFFAICLLTRDSAANADDADTCFAPLHSDACRRRMGRHANTTHRERVTGFGPDSAEVPSISLCYVEENNHSNITYS